MASGFVRPVDRPARVAVVGAGLAGLACARTLSEAGVSVVLLDRSDRAGGRVRTDLLDGFLLDRGFQVLLTAYPEARRVLDYGALELRAFKPGALVRSGGRFTRLVDPWRDPLGAPRTLLSDVGTFRDKLLLRTLRRDVTRTTVEELSRRPETKIADRLRAHGFSKRFVDVFFAPLFGGITLDRTLGASSRTFDFVFKMMSEGDVAVPRFGMGRIAEQLFAALPRVEARFREEVVHVDPRSVVLRSGERIEADAVVVATDVRAAAGLLGVEMGPPTLAMTTLSFVAQAPPESGAWLVLNGDDPGPVNQLAVMSEVSEAYAPPGSALIAATLLGDHRPGVELEVRAQLRRWFGRAVDGWRLLDHRPIRDAQPDLRPAVRTRAAELRAAAKGIVLAGDHCADPSIQGALASGRRSAQRILGRVDEEPSALSA